MPRSMYPRGDSEKPFGPGMKHDGTEKPFAPGMKHDVVDETDDVEDLPDFDEDDMGENPGGGGWGRRRIRSLVTTSAMPDERVNDDEANLNDDEENVNSDEETGRRLIWGSSDAEESGLVEFRRAPTPNQSTIGDVTSEFEPTTSEPATDDDFEAILGDEDVGERGCVGMCWLTGPS